jgi:hypothetical protein
VFSGAAIELALASYPGFHVTAPPADATPFGVYRPGWVPQDAVEHVVVAADGTRTAIAPPPPPPPPPHDDHHRFFVAPARVSGGDHGSGSAAGATGGDHGSGGGATRRVPLGTLCGARSGDKGGTANIGVWTRSDAAARWLTAFLTPERVRELLPEATGLPVAVYPLPNLRAVNIVIDGLLGDGVASSTRFDPQGKALGEWLRSRLVDVPEELLT